MFLQTGTTTRRQFLERSALGAGSVLFLPGLLGSCTDHLPGPDTPIIPWPLTDVGINWNEAAKAAVTTGIEAIPEVGEILGPLVEVFWPKTKEDIWGQVKAQVEELVDQKIADNVYQQVSEDLGSLTPIPTGLIGALTLYQNEVKNGRPADIDSQWMTTRSLFVSALGHFQSKGYEQPLLGLFGQFANLYLALLRDGYLFGESWGRTPADVRQTGTDLQTAITEFTNYTTKWYKAGRTNLEQNTPRNDLANESFRTVNKFDRQMAFLVLDFRDTWKYYDVTKYRSTESNPIEVVLTREIYSDPMGSIANSSNPNIVIPLPVPTQRPTQLSLWGGENKKTNGVQVTAVQVTYPAGSGPGGVTQTPRMGVQNFGSNQPPYGDLVNLSHNNPVIAVQCTYATYTVDSFQLTFHDGTKTNVIGGGGNPNSTKTATWTFPSDFMSSILITGVSYIAGGDAAACIIFGFQHWQPPSLTLKSIQALYITSPKERSAADLAKTFPKHAIPANFITEELKTARQAHWASIQARALTLK